MVGANVCFSVFTYWADLEGKSQAAACSVCIVGLFVYFGLVASDSCFLRHCFFFPELP